MYGRNFEIAIQDILEQDKENGSFEKRIDEAKQVVKNQDQNLMLKFHQLQVKS
jgi:hypothetical protein